MRSVCCLFTAENRGDRRITLWVPRGVGLNRRGRAVQNQWSWTVERFAKALVTYDLDLHAADWLHASKVPWIGRMRPTKDLSFVVTNELALRPVGQVLQSRTFLMHYPISWRMHGHLEEAFLWPHGPYRIKLTFIFLKIAVRHSQGSVGAPHGLENSRASDAQSVNVRRKVVDHRLICEHVHKTSLRSWTTDFGPHNLYGWGQILEAPARWSCDRHGFRL